jgi:hypothetical protein
MTAAEHAWVMTLPGDAWELERIRAELQREVERAEYRFAEVQVTGGQRRKHRQATMELTALQGKLRLLRTRLAA